MNWLFDEDKENYSHYLLRSYVEDSKNVEWCSGPGCECSVEFVNNIRWDSSSCDVVCGSKHSFCCNCLDDAHRPVDYDTVHKWAVKNTAESENVTWILANSKSCPKCRKPIKKNDGCMHMTCPCKFHFCWLCLGDWSTHGESTCGCFKMKSEDFEKLYVRYGESEMQLKFITDAWLQIIECRRVLKYYLPESEHAKKSLFEYLQGEAQSGLERLHQYVEQELQP
ncbi:hypothetical protein MKX01_030553 [Papaver californicum]|nr:hypothetical protein MKX01_030553 [Papaver californicum]